jgi:hypothetical protein
MVTTFRLHGDFDAVRKLVAFAEKRLAYRLRS